jgi:hypothetical protein
VLELLHLRTDRLVDEVTDDLDDRLLLLAESHLGSGLAPCRHHLPFVVGGMDSSTRWARARRGLIDHLAVDHEHAGREAAVCAGGRDHPLRPRSLVLSRRPTRR